MCARRVPRCFRANVRRYNGETKKGQKKKDRFSLAAHSRNGNVRREKKNLRSKRRFDLFPWNPSPIAASIHVYINTSAAYRLIQPPNNSSLPLFLSLLLIFNHRDCVLFFLLLLLLFLSFPATMAVSFSQRVSRYFSMLVGNDGAWCERAPIHYRGDTTRKLASFPPPPVLLSSPLLSSLPPSFSLIVLLLLCIWRASSAAVNAFTIHIQSPGNRHARSTPTLLFPLPPSSVFPYAPLDAPVERTLRFWLTLYRPKNPKSLTTVTALIFDADAISPATCRRILTISKGFVNTTCDTNKKELLLEIVVEWIWCAKHLNISTDNKNINARFQFNHTKHKQLSKSLFIHLKMH